MEVGHGPENMSLHTTGMSMCDGILWQVNGLDVVWLEDRLRPKTPGESWHR